jgi:hypothetical protein
MNQGGESMAQKLGVRDLTERREKLEKMYTMIYALVESAETSGKSAIIGEGFSIVCRGNCCEVHRKGEPPVMVVPRVTRIAPLFTPEMFCDGVDLSTALQQKRSTQARKAG